MYLQASPSTHSMYLRHVRLPFQSSSVSGGGDHLSLKPFGYSALNIHSSFFNRGVLFAANTYNDREDMLWLVDGAVSTKFSSPSLPPSSNYIEYHSTNLIEGKTWCISELKSEATLDKFVNPNDVNLPYQSYSSVTSAIVLDRFFVALTNMGVTILKLSSPSSLLLKCLKMSQTGDSELFKKITIHYSPRELTSLALVAYHRLISTSSPTYSSDVRSKLLDTLTGILLQNSLPLQVSPLSGPPLQNGVLGLAIKEDSISFDSLSPKIQGMFIYIARILNPLWKLSCTDLVMSSGTNSSFHLVMPLQETMRQLSQGLSLLKSLSSTIFSGTLVTNAVRWSPSNIETMKKSMEIDFSVFHYLISLCEHFSQGIQLVLLLLDHPLNDYFNDLSASSKTVFQCVTLESLLLSQAGRSVLVELVSLIVQKRMASSSTLDISETMVEIFSEKCPLYFSSADYKYFKAYELLHHAKKSSFSAEKASMIQDAIEKVEKYRSELSLARLTSLSEELCLLYQHPTAIKFVLECLEAQLSLQSAEISVVIDPFCAIIFYVLEDAISLYRNPSSKLTEAKAFFQSCLAAATNCSFEVYHDKLYHWFIGNGWIDIIPSLPYSPYLQEFLLTLQEEHENAPILKDLLWKYYVYHNQFIKASRCLLFLAELSPGNKLLKRMEYLMLARVYCMNTGNRDTQLESTMKQLSSEVNDRIDIAEIQSKILHTLQEMHPSMTNEISLLNEKLYSLSDLFNLFAQPLELYELGLEIIHCSQYAADSGLVTSLWSKLIANNYDSNIPSTFVQLLTLVTSIGKRFLPSEVAFPTSMS